MKMLSAHIKKNKNCHSTLYFLKVKCIKSNPSVFILCYNYIERLLMLNVTKYTDA